MTRSIIAEAVERHRLADVAARTGLRLPRTTGTVSVSCPMPAHGHPDSTPSMRLFLDQDRYYCHGCGCKGDVVQWVRDAEGVSVAEACRILDSNAPITNAWPNPGRADHWHPSPARGWPVPAAAPSPTDPGPADLPDPSRTPAERVVAAISAAWAYYTTPAARQAASDYLAARRLDLGVIERWTGRLEAGHTPAGRDDLVRHLLGRGFTVDELVDAGLARRRGEQVSDYYRDRLLLPIRAADGTLRGFIGRATSPAAERVAKYLNPPNNILYSKHETTYMLTGNMPAAGRPRVVVVEGPLDAVAITQAAALARRPGIIAAALCGCDLSPTQVAIITNLDPQPVLAFDGDPPGQAAAARAATTLTALGANPHVAQLPAGADPADLVRTRGIYALDVIIPAEHPAGRPASTFDLPLTPVIDL